MDGSQPLNRASTQGGGLVVIRSSDGGAFSLLPQNLLNISTLDELRYNILTPLLGIPPDCLILMNDQGIPLTRDESVQHLVLLLSSQSSDQSGESHREARDNEKRLYVFDREHLDAEPESVARSLRIEEEDILNEPPLNLEDPLTSHLHLSIHHLSALQDLTSTITNQRSSLSLALSNLHRVNTGTSTSFHLYLETAKPLMERYEALLEGWEENMSSIRKVRVVSGLLVRGGSGSGSTIAGHQHQREGSTSSANKGGEEKQRYLGDYVSAEKMMAVRDGCAKVLAELRMRTEQLQVTLDDVVQNAEAVQADLEATSRDLEDLEACEQDAEHGHMRIEELVHAGESMTDPELRAQCFEELSVCDAEHRDRIRFLIERKNAMTRYLLLQMQKISTLQSDIASMPGDLGVLDHDLRTRTENFKHLARLEGLIPAYVATMAEVVRRREYGRLLDSHSRSLSALLEPLTTLELSRRKHYRTNFSGKLPWEVRGLGAGADEIIPEIGFAVDMRGMEGLPELGRDILEQLRTSFEDLVQEISATNIGDSSSSISSHPLKKAKKLLDDMIANIDELSKDFDRLATNTSLPEPAIDTTQIALLEAQLRQLEESNETLSRQLQSERSSHEETVAMLENKCSTAEGAEERERGKVAKLEKERFEREKVDVELRKEMETITRELQEEKQLREEVEGDLVDVRGGMQRMEKLVEEKEKNLAELIGQHQQMGERLVEKEKELKELRSEAELDRAVLEKELEEVRKVIETNNRDLERHQGRNRTLEEIAEGLREQIGRWETVVQSREEDIELAKRELEDSRRDKEKGIVDVQKELVQAQRQARSAVIIAAKLRDENDNITRALNTPPPPKPDSSTTTELDKAAQPPSSASPPPPTVPSLDYASCDIDELLRELEQVSHVPLTEAIRNKMDGMTTLTKKWVKEAKAYRERAHRATSGANDKIAFRHFAIGDLCLFLPTRNSTVPVWAAFNVSFPHHFLSPTGVIAEQMKTREWIVARITSLSETVVDTKDSSTNPYDLNPGTKFFMLEVEPWSSKESSRARKHSSDKEKNKNGERKTSSSSRIHPSRSSSEAIVPSKAASSTADSGILIDRPISASSPNIRRTVSEGFPSSSTPTARSDYAIAEVEEPEIDDDSRPPSPNALRQSAPRTIESLYDSTSASPSGLTRALARSQPATPNQQTSDPFVPSSSPTTNPFPNSSSPVVSSPLRSTISPLTTDYDPSHSTTGASPAFLPSATKKHVSSTSSTTLNPTNSSPRYIRSSPSSRKDSRSLSISGGRPSPAANLLSSSPASSSANSINHVSGQARSASSGSSILSSSMHRRGVSGLHGISPSTLPDGKALPTNEAQLTDSRWNLLHDELADQAGTTTDSIPVVKTRSSIRKTTASPPPVVEPSRFGSIGRSGLPSSASTPSVFDILRGKSRSSGNEAKKGKETETGSAEGEIRKLMGQPLY